jgi:hypothetical protein
MEGVAMLCEKNEVTGEKTKIASAMPNIDFCK